MLRQVSIFFLGLAAVLPALTAQPVLLDPDARYRLQPGDTIDVQYRYTPEYNATGVIHPDGFLDLPLVGDLKLGGLTAQQASQAIEERAAERLRDPEVTVVLKDFVRPSYVVAGQVAHPGRFEMRGRTSLIQAIAISGGFLESSKHSEVVLVREYNQDFAEVKVINVKELMKPDSVAEDIELRPGDTLIVPQNALSKIDRLVSWSNMAAFGLTLTLR